MLFSFLEGIEAETLPVPDGPTDASLAALVARSASPRGIVLAVHGFTGSKEDFILVLAELADAGWSAVAPDLRGHYESAHIGPYDLDRLAADIVALAQSLGADGLPVHLLGHSYGGVVSQRALALDPTAFASLLVVCSGPGGLATVRPDQPISVMRAEQFSHVLAGRTLEEAWEAQEEIGGTVLDTSNPLVGFFKERFLSSDRAALEQTNRDLLGAPDVATPGAATGVPVRWSFGESDGSWSQALQRATAALYATEAHVIDGAGHMAMVENSEGTLAWLLTALDDVSAR